jgi:hypothetical protein
MKSKIKSLSFVSLFGLMIAERERDGSGIIIIVTQLYKIVKRR